MNRAEHLQWSKERALTCVDNGDITNAFASFQSDMMDHKETSGHLALTIGMSLMLSGNLSSPADMTNWIKGFN